MAFMEIDKELFRKLTSLQKALEVYEKDKFLQFKRDLLVEEFDEDEQIRIWEDYHNLMFKAAKKTFNPNNWELLQSYRYSMTGLDPVAQLFNSMREAIHIPAQEIYSQEGRVEFSRKYLDQEVTAKLFEHIFNVLVGLEEIRVCAADDCEELFIPAPQGREQEYHSQNCYWREYRRKERSQKRKVSQK